jgi:glucosamine 6-phosphate synthetase-like amidotransferase/phosphosugar isomerase protein
LIGAEIVLRTSPMRQDIERQPAVLGDLANRSAAFVALGRDQLKLRNGGRLFVYGCGDGLFAAQSASGHAESLNLDWRPIGALDLVLSSDRLTQSDRVVAISMSGNVDRTVEAARATAARGVPLVALVNGRGGKLAEIANSTISLDLPDIAPFLCGTASYTASLLALMMLASGAAGRAVGPSVADVVLAQLAVFGRSDDVVKGLSVPTGIRLLSAGSDRGTAQYGAAKFVELTRIPAWSSDLEDFSHSQYWAMPTSNLVVVVAADRRLAPYADACCLALRDLGVETLAIENVTMPITNASYRIALPVVDRALVPLVTPIPLQILAAAMARRTGLDPDTRMHLKADEARFRVSRLLTRRSLVGTGQ